MQGHIQLYLFKLKLKSQHSYCNPYELLEKLHDSHIMQFFSCFWVDHNFLVQRNCWNGEIGEAFIIQSAERAWGPLLGYSGTWYYCCQHSIWIITRNEIEKLCVFLIFPLWNLSIIDSKRLLWHFYDILKAPDKKSRLRTQ